MADMPVGFELLSPVWTHLTYVQPVRAKGTEIFDADDQRYLDFTSGIGVINTGHCHPRIVQAVQEQAGNLLFGQMNIVLPPVMLKLAQKLNTVTPDSIDQFFFSNSGAEATEAAVKLARHASSKRNVIVFQGSFHGRTHQAMAMTTSKYVYRYNYQPLPGGIFIAPFPYSYQYGWSDAETTDFCMRELDLLLRSQTAPDETAMIIIEPVLGEGGYVPAPLEFLQELRQFCDKHNILLALDEVQSGFGRTGSFFCFEQADIQPDIIVMAKGLGSGLPISAIGASKELMSRWKPGTHGGTYGGGSAIAGAAACATIDVLQEEQLIENAQKLGRYLKQQLRELQQHYPVIGDVRGRGLMVATEFRDAQRNPDSEITAKVLKACIEAKLLILSCGSYGNVIRWIPPLVVTQQQIDEALAIFENALKKAGANHA